MNGFYEVRQLADKHKQIWATKTRIGNGKWLALFSFRFPHCSRCIPLTLQMYSLFATAAPTAATGSKTTTTMVTPLWENVTSDRKDNATMVPPSTAPTPAPSIPHAELILFPLFLLLYAKVALLFVFLARTLMLQHGGASMCVVHVFSYVCVNLGFCNTEESKKNL